MSRIIFWSMCFSPVLCSCCRQCSRVNNYLPPTISNLNQSDKHGWIRMVKAKPSAFQPSPTQTPPAHGLFLIFSDCTMASLNAVQFAGRTPAPENAIEILSWLDHHVSVSHAWETNRYTNHFMCSLSSSSSSSSSSTIDNPPTTTTTTTTTTKTISWWERLHIDLNYWSISPWYAFQFQRL